MEKNYKTYLDLLLTPTKEEEDLKRAYSQEIDDFQATPEYVAHRARLQTIAKKQKELQEQRLAEAKKQRPQRKPIKRDSAFAEEQANKKQEKFEALPDNIKKLVSDYSNLTETEQKIFAHETQCYYSKLENFENPQTTKKDLKELLEILVQTCIDFINERNIKDIDEISFGADSLQESTKHGVWTPATDASISTIGIQKQTFEDGSTLPVRKIIGTYC